MSSFRTHALIGAVEDAVVTLHAVSRGPDAVGARAAARDIGVHASLAGEHAFTFGLLHERADAAAHNAAHHTARAWKRAEKKKALKWLG